MVYRSPKSQKRYINGLLSFRPSILEKSEVLAVHNSELLTRAVAAIIASGVLILLT